MDTVRLGVVGCGVMGRRHAEQAANADGIELVAVADLREERVREVADARGAAKRYAHGRELIADPDVDAVVFAMPAADRDELAVAAFEAGKHVLVEKPVARDAEWVRRLIAAKGNRVGACCSSRNRFRPAAQRVTEFLADDPLGELREVRCRHIVPPRAAPPDEPVEWRLRRDRNGGGILLNWGCYDIDYLLGLLGWRLEPETVFAQTWGVPEPFAAYAAPGSDAETHYTALIRCKGGAVISLERAEFIAAEPDAGWEIIGELGSLRIPMLPHIGKEMTWYRRDPEGAVARELIWTEADEASAGPVDEPALDFCAAIRDGRPPKTTLEQALVVQRLSDGIYESAATGKAVDLL